MEREEKEKKRWKDTEFKTNSDQQKRYLDFVVLKAKIFSYFYLDLEKEKMVLSLV